MRRWSISARLLAVVALVAAGCGSSGPSADAEQESWVEIRGQRVALELALEPEEMALGLGQRDSLAWDRGMLFLYPHAGFYSFWMKDMRFDIDILWLLNGRIVEIASRVPFHEDGPGPSLRPRSLADTVLEVPSGYSEAHGWRVGDRTTYHLTLPEGHPRREAPASP